MVRRVLALATVLAAAVAAAPSQAAHSFVLTRAGALPSLAVDGSGTGHFVWDQRDANGASITHYCRVPRGARACAPGSERTFQPTAVSDPGGIHAVWQERGLRYRVTNRAATHLVRARRLASGSGFFNLAVAAGANGHGWVAWDSNANNRTVRAIPIP